jgi:hypothetical protein
VVEGVRFCTPRALGQATCDSDVDVFGTKDGSVMYGVRNAFGTPDIR